ncbi:hypothetical protein RUM43_009103 [Polyplax serrata]|uniref:mRNA cap guanine-N(7) methyltransferase n=1 Tax=Polyplax serrata TaxID=468196 RepID=A0AAN8S0Y2_POLSC
METNPNKRNVADENAEEETHNNKKKIVELDNEKNDDLLQDKESVEDKNKTGTSEPVQFAEIVAAHYNSLESHKDYKRKSSKIYYLRNFNNFIKSVLIKDSVMSILDGKQHLNVLDMCCGKGGDIIKWIKTNARHLICADIAERSLELCKERLEHLTKVRLCTLYEDPSIKFDVVSSQFSFHYSFESLPQVECMLQNASERLKPGGIFIGTIPNSNEIVKRLRMAKTNSFGNDLYSLEMCSSEPYPLFGAKYNFYLEGVLNCPEFLVYFPLLEKLAAKFGLKLLQRKRFDDMFEEKRNDSEAKLLLRKINALEGYPPRENERLYRPEEDYKIAKTYWEQHGSKLRERGIRITTISQSEWEVITLYELFIFQKKKT